MSAIENSAEIRSLYLDKSFDPRVWRDSSDHAYIGIHCIERSICLLAGQLSGTLLDVGCGTQPYKNYFSHVTRTIACDFDSKRGKVDFECPAHKIPLADCSIDSILCTEVLEHVPDPAAVWREFGRILKPRGKVLLTTPMAWPGHEEPYDFFRYTEHGLRHLTREGGFEVLRLIPRGGAWCYFGQTLLHTMPQYFRFRWQRRVTNLFFIWLDSRRCAPRLTLGWTILASKGLG